MTDSVTFRKQVSDGNYGSETIEVTLDVPEGEAAQDVLMVAQSVVHQQLAQSLSASVRRAVQPPVLAKPGDADDVEDLPF